MIKFLILAGSHEQYKFFVKNNNLKEKQCREIKSRESLYGFENPIIIYTGTYYLNPAYKATMEFEINSRIKAL